MHELVTTGQSREKRTPVKLEEVKTDKKVQQEMKEECTRKKG